MKKNQSLNPITLKKIAPGVVSKGHIGSKSIISPQATFVKANASKAKIGFHQTQSGFLISRWGFTKEFSDFDEAIYFLNKMGVKL